MYLYQKYFCQKIENIQERKIMPDKVPLKTGRQEREGEKRNKNGKSGFSVEKQKQ